MKKIETSNSYIILLLIIFLFSECNTKNNLENKLIRKDSIFIYLKNSKDKSSTIEIRKQNLYKAYKKNSYQKNDSIKNSNLRILAFDAFNLNDSTFFKKVNLEAQNLSTKLHDTFGIADTHWNYGLYYTQHEILDSAYFHYLKAYKYYRVKRKDLFAGRMLYNMAVIQYDIKDYTGSEISAIKCIPIFKKLNKTEDLFLCYNLLGTIYKQIEEYDKAITYHKKALEYLNNVSKKEINLELSLNNLGLVFQKQGNYKSAVFYFEKALENKKLKQQDINLYARLIDNLAYTKFLSGDTLHINQSFYKALQIRDSINFISGIVISNLHLAEFYAKYSDTTKAIKYATEANKLALRADNNRDVLASLLLLSKLDKNNSTNYFNNYVKTDDSLQAQDRKIRNKFTRIRFETDEYIEKTEKLSKQKLLISIGSIILIIILSLLYYIRIQRTKTKELLFEKEQQKANEEIYSLMLKQQSTLEEGRLKERQRISEDLHDGVLGKIFGTRLALGFLNFKTDIEAASKRKEHIDELQNIEKEIRIISHELKNELLSSQFDFITLVDNLLKTQSQISHFKFEIINNQVIWDKLSNEIKINFYRIIQEAIQNINKYAKAKNVSIEFDINSNYIYLYIKDDGAGFNIANKNKGIGLTNMKSRTSKLKGTFEIKSVINNGTLIKIAVPVETINHNENL